MPHQVPRLRTVRWGPAKLDQGLVRQGCPRFWPGCRMHKQGLFLAMKSTQGVPSIGLLIAVLAGLPAAHPSAAFVPAGPSAFPQHRSHCRLVCLPDTVRSQHWRLQHRVHLHPDQLAKHRRQVLPPQVLPGGPVRWGVARGPGLQRPVRLRHLHPDQLPQYWRQVGCHGLEQCPCAAAGSADTGGHMPSSLAVNTLAISDRAGRRAAARRYCLGTCAAGAQCGGKWWPMSW